MPETVNLLMIFDGQIDETKLSITRDQLAGLAPRSWKGGRTNVIPLSADAAGEHLDTVRRSHQIWLFGYNGAEHVPDDRLNAAILERMDAGCGVFATGDHDSRGFALCGDVPRVRQLRRWGHGGQDVRTANAPEFGIESIDTVFPLPDGGEGSEEDRQFKPVYVPITADGIPEVMRLGDSGSIAWLPDHPHEGSLDPGPTPDYSDFPSDSSRSIETVAWAMAWRRPCKDGPRLEPRAVPIVRVYDPPPELAHGRIVVDSTFHHWLYINLSEVAASASIAPSQPFRHWQAYASNIYQFLLPRKYQ